MDIKDYILKQPVARQNILTKINLTILESDKSVKGEVATMMGKEMIIYKCNGLMKYGLSSVKNHMSLHVLPIYGSAKLHSKYKSLLNKAIFQKGCINFDDDAKMPADIVQKLIVDCAPLDLAKIKEDYLKQKKTSQKE
jgi:hypothetical protein